MPSSSRTTRFGTRIPPELIDTVIDFNHSDGQELLACTLVSKTFLRSCRYHLFSRVPVKLRPNTVEVFLSLTQHPLSTIVPYIRHVVVGDDLSFWKQAKLDALHAALLFLAGLDTVRSLHLNKLNWRNIGARCRTLFMSPGKFKALTDLEITCVTFETFTELIDCLCASPSLRRISLFKVSWRMSDPPTQSLPQPSLLQSLYLCYSDSEPILSWLLAQKPLPALKSLTLFHIRSRWTPSVGPFLSSLSSSLEHLELDASFFRTENLNINHVTAEFSTKVNLSHNIALRSIQFADLHPPTDTSWALFILSKLTSPRLLSVEFIIALRTLPDIDTIDWGCLTETFTRSTFVSVKRVECRVTGSVDMDMVVRGIKQRLAVCDRRGILSVVYGGVSEPHPRERRDGLLW